MRLPGQPRQVEHIREEYEHLAELAKREPKFLFGDLDLDLTGMSPEDVSAEAGRWSGITDDCSLATGEDNNLINKVAEAFGYAKAHNYHGAASFIAEEWCVASEAFEDMKSSHDEDLRRQRELAAKLTAELPIAAEALRFAEAADWEQALASAVQLPGWLWQDFVRMIRHFHRKAKGKHVAHPSPTDPTP